MHSVEQVLREEIRALQIEKVLLGYVMACCAEDVPDDEMRELLFGRVLSMTSPALLKTEERCGLVLRSSATDFVNVIAEEINRVIELCIAQDLMMSAGAVFIDIGAAVN